MIRFRTLVPALLLAAALPSRGAAQAYPTDRGAFIVGGTGGVSTTSMEFEESEAEVRVTSAFLSPTVQYFVAPGLAVGGRLDVSGTWSDGNSDAALGLGPQISYYFGRGDQRMYPFVTAGAAYFTGYGDNGHETGANAAAGITFMLSRGVGLETSLYYRGQYAELSRVDSFGVGLGIAAFVF